MRSKKSPSPIYVYPCLIVAILLLWLPAHAQTYDLQLSNRRSLKPDWFGIGSQNTTREGMYISHPDLLEHAPEMKAKVVRFPAGGNANWWDWKKGWYVDDPQYPPHQDNDAPVFNTLENFKLLTDEMGAVPLFVLNMVSSSLQYQLEMLHYADSIGLQVKYVELGNEFYLTSDEDSAFIYTVFPDALVYGTVCSQWIDSIHFYFPDAKVAAQGAFNRNNQPKRVQWDIDLVQTLEGEDAITLHQYFSASKTEATGAGDGKYTTADVAEFLSRPYKAWNIMSTEDLPMVRPGREVWITEYNMQDFSIPVHGSWAHGLFVATQSLLFLESEKITNVNFHTICGSSAYGGYFIDNQGFSFPDDESFVSPPIPPITTPWDLTATGNTMQLIGEATDGMKYASTLNFESAPFITFVADGDTITYPALYGVQFSNDVSSSAVILNLSGNELNINTLDVFNGSGSYNLESASPTKYVARKSDVTRGSSSLPATYAVPAYSIIKISSDFVPAPPPSSVSITALGNTTFCQGDSVSLDAGVGYYAYLWSTGETSRNIRAKASGDYWLRAWNQQNGYWVADTIAVLVNPLPEIPIIKNDGPGDFCMGESTTLTPKTIDPNINYVWSESTVGSTLTVTASGNYSVTLTDQNGCSSVSAATPVIVYPLPEPVISPSGPLSFCDGGSVTLNVDYGYKNYKWSNDKYGQSQEIATAGTYSVTVTDSNNCKNTTASFTVTVYLLPNPTVAVTGPIAFCDGTSPTHLTAPSGYMSYQWSKGSDIITGATDKEYYPVSDATYKVAVTDDLNCSGKSSGTDITVLSLPAIPVIKNDGGDNFCMGESTTLTVKTIDSYATYIWSDGSAGPTLAVSASGSYSVTVTDQNGCSSVSPATPIVVYPLPEPVISPSGPLSFCDGGSVTLNVDNGYKNYKWSNDKFGQSQEITTAGTYSVTVTDSNNCKNTTDSFTVTVYLLPNPTADVTGPIAFCDGTSPTYLSAPSGYMSYQWSKGSVIITGATDKKYYPVSDATYKVTVTDDLKCSGKSSGTDITVLSLPAIPVIKNDGGDNFCMGESTTLTVKTIDSYATYIWSDGSAGPALAVSTSGSFSVTVTNQNSCSSVSEATPIVMHPLPEPVISPSGPLAFCSGGSVILNADEGYESYKWSNDKYGQAQEITTTGTFSVTVTDSNNCKGASLFVSVVVYSLPSSNIEVTGPTAFCSGTSPTYLTAPSGYVSYQWSKGAANIIGATDKKYYPVSKGTYKVAVTDNFNCYNKSSGTVITALSLPTAKITKVGGKNICPGQTKVLSATTGSGYTYQWIKNGENITGAILSVYTALSAGDYKCKVTGPNGCSNTSNVIGLTSNCKEIEEQTGIRNDPASITVYPNPAADFIHINADFSGEESVAVLQIRNLIGELVYSEQQSTTGSQFNTEVSLQGRFTNGVYVATVISGSKVVTSKFVVTANR